MKIALLGYGKMGCEVEQAARVQGVEIAAIIDPAAPGATHREITAAALKDADVVIDFTTPAAVVANAEKVAAAGKNLVIGTTGWYDRLEEVKKAAAKHDTGLLYSSNFSVGVNAFFRVVETASRLFNKLEMYDAFGYELHHRQKMDSPSGTAKSIEQIMLQQLKRKAAVVEDRLDRKIKPEELHFASVRAGWIPGTHVVGFDSEADTIELKHTARSRKGFATGAVLAAQWLCGRKGFYSMGDFMKDFFA